MQPAMDIARDISFYRYFGVQSYRNCASLAEYVSVRVDDKTPENMVRFFLC